MTPQFSKPDIYFAPFPLVNIWIKSDYDKIETPEELLNFIHKGLNEIETSSNEIRVTAYKKIIYPLISIHTNKSYESVFSLD